MISNNLLTSGQCLDRRYQITRTLATGGFGHTYLAQDTKRPGKPICVVKQLKSHNAEVLDKVRKLFTREGEILEKLGEHPQIPRLLAYFEVNGEFYLVQEYIRGSTLAQELDNQAIWLEKQVINLLIQLLEILDFVHAQGVIHRDIKPTNIIRRKQDNKLVLIDFGAVKEIATLENQTMIIYSQGYAPPEQYYGQLSISSDIYAVGIIGIQALTGINPSLDTSEGGFDWNNRGEIIWQNRVKVNVRNRLSNILTRMICRQQQKRYGSVKEVLRELNQLHNFTIDNSHTANPPSLKLSPSERCGQKPSLPIFGIICILILGFTAFFLTKKPLLIEQQNLVPAPQLTLNGQKVAGTLHSNSPIEPMKNTYYDTYLFQGRQGERITIEMKSNEFDPALTLLKPNRQVLAINDDISPRNFNSQIVVTLPEDGQYQLVVRASQPGELGNYQLKAATN